jgi:Ca-activated chloride channel family protein
MAALWAVQPHHGQGAKPAEVARGAEESIMTFARAWVLLFALAPLAWAAWDWRTSARRVALALKAIALACVIVALSEPRFNFNDTKVAVAALVDTSASVAPRDLANASALLNGMERKRGSSTLQVIPFARATRNPSLAESAKAWNIGATGGDAGHGTNLENAIRDAVAGLPSGLVHRVALISDGHENLGTVTRATWQAQQLGIPVDTFAMAGRPKPNLRADSVSLPAQVFSGERFPIDLTVTAPKKTTANVEISAEGKKLGVSTVELEPGANHFRVRTSLTAIGAVDLAGTISAPGLGDTRFEQAVTVRRPHVLVLSQDPAGSEAHLMQVLALNQFDVQQTPQNLPAKLDDYQMLVFNNWDMENVPASDKARIEEFEQQGGGVLWIAGEKNVYVEKKPGTPEDPLERAFPAKLAPPRSPEGTCVVLIIDKSSSMEGKKMELARLASIGVINNLRPIDTVGILIFDNSFQWAVPIRKAEDKSLIERLIAGITPDGGTQIAPALSEAYHKVAAVNAVYKHIVLLTDGISEEGDSMGLSREAAANRVTISTVGLGQDVNRAYLEKVAASAKGKSYFLNDPGGLEQILLKDVQEHTGTTAVEKSTKVGIVQKAELLEGVGMESAPALQGYVRFITKPSANEVLNIDQQTADKKDPLFVRWQYGLGRAAVFTSDAKSRWASAWIAWPGFDKFWANVFRDLLPHAPMTEATAGYDDASGEIVVDYHLGQHIESPSKIPDIFVLGPNNFRKPMKTVKLASGVYRASIAIGTNEGLFRIRPVEESRAFPEVGFYRQETELLDYGANEFLLKQIAQSTGGRYYPNLNTGNAAQVFDSGGRSVPGSLQLWPGLLALAILLNLIELVLRKWKGLVEALRGRVFATQS